MSTRISPLRDSSVFNKPQQRSPASISRTDSSATLSVSSHASSRSSTPPAVTLPTRSSNSFVETILSVLQILQTTIWIYILSLESLVRQYIEQYRNGGIEDNEVEKTLVKRDSIPEIVGRSRTGTNIREVVIGGGSKRGSMDSNLKDSSNQSGSSSENERRPVKKSTKGTGFEEPFCKFRNTTLPHPAADLSPNASISAPDIAYSKVQHHRMRIPGRRSSNKNVSHGKILPTDARFASSGRLGAIAVNESAMGSSLEGLYDDIVYEDGSKEMVLTKSRTGLSGSTSVGSPVEPIKEVDIPSVKIIKPEEMASVDPPRLSTTSDWEGETSKALEKIMSPLNRHPVTITKIDSLNSTYAENFITTPIRTSSTARPSTAPSSPIIKPGGFRRVSATPPQHNKKDSGIGISRSELGSRDSSSKMKSSREFGDSDRTGNGEEDEKEGGTPTKKRERGLLRKMRIQKT